MLKPNNLIYNIEINWIATPLMYKLVALSWYTQKTRLLRRANPALQRGPAITCPIRRLAVKKRSIYLITSLLVFSMMACQVSQISISINPTVTPANTPIAVQTVAVDTVTPEVVASPTSAPVSATDTPTSPTSTPVQAVTESTEKHTSPPKSIVEFQITNDEEYQKAPRISGDTVVWFQPEKSPEGVTSSNVYAYSLSQKTTKKLSNQGIYPVVYGDSIVWAELNAATQAFSLVRYHVGDGTKEVLVGLDLFDYSSPGSRFTVAASALNALVNRSVSYTPYDLSDQYLVWVDIKAEKYTLQGYSIAQNELLTIDDKGRYPMAPRLFDAKVVWSDDRGNGVNLFQRDLPAGEPITVTQSINKKMLPAISSQYLVWLDVTHEPYKIMALDLVSGESWAITSPAAQPSTPRVDGDIVVWADTRNGNSDIYGYFLPTKTEFQITSDPADQTWPDISNQTVVWMDHRGGKWDLYGATLDWK